MTTKVIDILSATHLRDYEIRLVFNDGTSQTVDFKPFLESAQHPDIRVFLEPAKFADYRIEYGELVWGDYDLCFPIMDLYTNRIDKRSRQEADA
jgi:Protein of unknown function (DUF2442)